MNKKTFTLNCTIARTRLLLLLIFLFAFTGTPVKAQDFWQPTNGPIGGRVNCLQSNLSSDIFAGTAGGVFVLNKGSNSWIPRNDGLTNKSIGSLAINLAGHVYAGATNGDVFVSTNSGHSWTKFNLGKEESIMALGIDRSGHIFAGTRGGVYRSMDNGGNWTAINTGLTSTDVKALATNFNDIFVGTDKGVFRSLDNGNKWTAINTGLTNTDVRALAINDSSHIFAGTFAGVFRSRDNGDNWTHVGLSHTSSIVINASSGHIFAETGIFEGGGVFRSTDNGDNWMPFVDGLDRHYNLSISFISYSSTLATDYEGHVLAGFNEGVFRTVDSEANWGEVNTDLAITNVNAVAINLKGDIFAVNTSAPLTHFRSTDNGHNWTVLQTPWRSSAVDGRKATLAINSKNHLFTGFQTQTECEIYSSADNGESWNFLGKFCSSSAMLISEADTSLEYIFVSGGIINFRSHFQRYGNSWADLVKGFPWSDSTVFGGVIIPGALDVNSSGFIFAGGGFGGGFYCSEDNGDNWLEVDARFRGIKINSIAVSRAPGSKDDVFLGTAGAGVFRYNNRTESWKQINFGLTVLNVKKLLVNSNAHIFAVTTNGLVFRTIDNGENWTEISSGLSGLEISSIAIDPGGFVYLGTRGSSVFRSTSSTIYPTAFDLSHTRPFPTHSSPSDFSSTDYRIVGLPGASEIPVTSLFSGTNGKDWRAYWDTGDSSNFFVKYNGVDSRFSFSAGRAFWIIKNRFLQIDLQDIPTAPLDANGAIKIGLHDGWNLITNPLLTPIAWSKVQSDSIDNPIWQYNGSDGFTESDTLRPYLGYYFDNTTGWTRSKFHIHNFSPNPPQMEP